MASYKASTQGESCEIKFDKNHTNTGAVNGSDFSLDSVKIADGKMHIIRNNQSYLAEIVSSDMELKTVSVKVNGHVFDIAVKDQYDALLDQLGMSNMNVQIVNEVKAPMPGLVLHLKAKPGDTIAKGDALLVLEAMKMENVLKSPTDGVVKSFAVEEGQAVEKNQLLVSFE
jgi:biotin carboxyl carrier protein